MKIDTYIIVVGLSGAGKTTFCGFLSAISNFPYINSGKAMRSFLLSQKIEVNDYLKTGKIFLENFNENLIYDIVYSLCAKDDSNIVDGIRLLSTLNGFKSNKDIRTITVFLDIEEEIRNQRFLGRLLSEGYNFENANDVIKRKDFYFNDVMALKMHSDFVIMNNGDLKSLQEKAKEFYFKISKSG